MWGYLGSVRQASRDLRGQMRWHPLPHYSWRPTPWGPNRRYVGEAGRWGATRLDLCGHNGLGEQVLREGGRWLLLQAPLRMFSPVVINELGVVLLLHPDLDTDEQSLQHQTWTELPLKMAPTDF